MTLIGGVCGTLPLSELILFQMYTCARNGAYNLLYFCSPSINDFPTYPAFETG